jgi:hypothetical protein
VDDTFVAVGDTFVAVDDTLLAVDGTLLKVHWCADDASFFALHFVSMQNVLVEAAASA